VLKAAEGMRVLAAENAINSALKIIKRVVNGKFEFPLF
jgi:hypothetical protein